MKTSLLLQFLLLVPLGVLAFVPCRLSKAELLHLQRAILPVALRATATDSTSSNALDEKQVDFTMGYMNKHHKSTLKSFAEAFSAMGEEQKKRNSWSGGSFHIEEATMVGISPDEMTLDVVVKERGKGLRTERVSFSLDATPVGKIKSPYENQGPIPPSYMDKSLPIDVVVRKLCRLSWIVNEPAVSGKLIQLGVQLGGAGIGELKENLYLNQVPHNRYVRQYFYDLASEATMEAVIQCSQGNISNRMKIFSQFPEMNPSMDSYRIGTILEMVRAIAIRLAEENLRVRVCVQGSMGVGIFTGVPKQLSGVARLVQMMDWQSNPGEPNEGMVGTYVNFGSVGKEHVVNKHTAEDGTVVEQDDVFLIIAPQNMVGVDSSIMAQLSEMVEAAGDRPVILINPDLTDKVSSQGQQSVRGRQDRINFANSFETIFHFQNIYRSGTSYFPILGSMTKFSPTGLWVAHQRRDLMNEEGEVYVPMLAGEEMPSGEAVLACFEN